MLLTLKNKLMLTQTQIKVNEQFFKSVITLLGEGNIYYWPATQEVYLLRNNKLTCSWTGYNRAKEVVSNKFLEENFIKTK
jgi:hypothetical protein